MNIDQQLAKHRDASQLASSLLRAAEEIRRGGDEPNAVKLMQLADKTRGKEMNIAFCGHFSAGKSTMINTLLGRELLPSNPIPTSANVVKIRGGEPAARVHTRENGVLTFDPDTGMDQLKAYAVDGDAVEWVEISYPGLFLGEETSLLDTPGIDSTDAAHKIATESALHLADVVIYMMDYNHVQAEENFNFTKTLKDREKPVYLVINMIDKHVDFELDFDSYKESVEEAFAMWNIRPDGIFYTSLAEPDHPENQFAQFRAKLLELLEQKEALIEASVVRSALHLVDEHVRFLARQQDGERRQWEAALDVEIEGVDVSSRDEVNLALLAAETKQNDLAVRVKTAEEEMESELSRLLDNARLTYYSTNEAAERYLESRKPGFKVGLLFSGKKTEEERAARLEALLGDFREKVASNLDWHFKQLIAKFPEAYGIRDEAFHAAAHAVNIEVTAEMLAAQVKEGAGTREYVLNYCKDISDAVKAEYRRVGLEMIRQVAASLSASVREEGQELDQQRDQLRKLLEAHQALEALSKREEDARARLCAILLEGE
ncbi:dynamin family protein [Brevibacillus massiliensis]|uniref:dynamin family protein n=1 Tax=Brevibacillus massiliensis TaxID=1118054 RepID=UPI0002E8CB6B|nr:dynamin family protein [Brevibacillus massiliensis]